MSVVSNIKRYREAKNFTQSYMAEQLDISQNTYSKLESGTIKLSVDRLEQISNILNVQIEDILSSSDEQHFNFHNSNIDKFYGYIENMKEDNKELLNTTIGILNEQVNYLRKENERLINLLSEKRK
ncbi:helix-turn-helix domain-containing protein [Myroides odoratimimus]|uniref:helix-turn-helix domain-containing protein n=1 Tax=Myroides odoratimimus TaxID=76832 RepID=UPI0025787EBC|nr:helix-turn-helix domain-containing protein [Myroides odoratimimus]MDM1060837.1 helix-turn-helix transcriptional regulator [Myroides odoratimimus]